jgi:ABC-2 type transport system ATP-binding protein
VNTATTTVVIEAKDVRRVYKAKGGDQYEAVRGVSLSVHAGELFALLGTNGSGKTSLMEVLEGHVLPSAGSCSVLGMDPYRQRGTLRQRLGIVLQDGSLQGDLTVGETLRMWSGTLTAPRDSVEVLRLVDLHDRSMVQANRLSGGERRRLDLALALLGRPEVLFLDEPTAGLDPESRARVHSLVRQILKDGGTVILTTHYLQEAQDLADRLAILHEGEVVAMGTPGEVVASTSARITFSLPREASAPRLALPAGSTLEAGTHTESRTQFTVSTQDLQPALEAVLAWATAHSQTLGDLEARPASLEQTFLDIAGTRTKAEAAAMDRP